MRSRPRHLLGTIVDGELTHDGVFLACALLRAWTSSNPEGISRAGEDVEMPFCPDGHLARQSGGWSAAASSGRALQYTPLCLQVSGSRWAHDLSRAPYPRVPFRSRQSSEPRQANDASPLCPQSQRAIDLDLAAEPARAVAVSHRIAEHVELVVACLRDRRGRDGRRGRGGDVQVACRAFCVVSRRGWINVGNMGRRVASQSGQGRLA